MKQVAADPVVGLVAQLVRDMSHEAARADLEALLFAAGAAELLGLGLGDAHHAHVDLAVEARVRGVCDGLGLHRRIHDHPIHAPMGDGLGAQPRVDVELEHAFHALPADPLAPLRHLAGVDREFVLEEFLAREELVVGVLDPAMDAFFNTEME